MRTLLTLSSPLGCELRRQLQRGRVHVYAYSEAVGSTNETSFLHKLYCIKRSHLGYIALLCVSTDLTKQKTRGTSMSLTTHLKHWKQSPVGQFLHERFPLTASITKGANSQLRNTSTIRPTGQSVPYPYMTLGMAIDYRIRYYFALTPSDHLRTARDGAVFLSFQPVLSDDDVPVDIEDVLNAGGPFSFDAFTEGATQGLYDWKTFASLFRDLDTALVQLRPIGQRLESEAEHLLARYCYVLALLDAVGRTAMTQQGPLVVPSPPKSTSQLLAIPRDAYIEDLRNMSWLFYEQCQDILSFPYVLNPTFIGSADVGGADADIIVDGCLMEIKASIKPNIEPNWLWQLAGYLLLDYEDVYHITYLGIYMARQGMRFQWSVEEFLHLLTGHSLTSLESLRHEFRSCFNRKSRSTHEKRVRAMKH